LENFLKKINQRVKKAAGIAAISLCLLFLSVYINAATDLAATGDMAGTTQAWTNPTYVATADGNYATSSTSGNKMYTEFVDSSDLGRITSVTFFITQYGETTPNDDTIDVNFTNDGGVHWWSKTNSDWTGTEADTFGSVTITAGETTGSVNITALYSLCPGQM
jgi:hypothetical protein